MEAAMVAPVLNPSHPYAGFARYALDQMAKRNGGEAVGSAVLVEQVSLTSPKTIDCGAKPMVAMIDLDPAVGATSHSVADVAGLGAILQTMRDRGVGIAWMSDRSDGELAAEIDALRAANLPVIKGEDLLLFGGRKAPRKQERRWSLAKTYCIVAVAGDRKSDFDELYDFLRDQDYAIRLDMFLGRGWFELAAPAVPQVPVTEDAK